MFISIRKSVLKGFNLEFHDRILQVSVWVDVKITNAELAKIIESIFVHNLLSRCARLLRRENA